MKTTQMNWLALDIGGANIKAANGMGFAAAYSFPMWRRHADLTQELRRVIAEAPNADRIVATMTGELADCFENKETGVAFILDSLQDAADGRHTRVYVTDGSLVTTIVGKRRHTEVAAANWHALARFSGRYLELGPALLVDVGSTTCDVIPFRDGLPVHTGTTDTQRLISGEMVYTGVQRSPICAISSTVPYRDHFCPLAQEVFATTHDVYTILGDLPEDSADHTSADGRPVTKAYARARLARAICAGGDQFNHRDAVAIAHAIAEAQTECLTAAIERVAHRLREPVRSVVLSGHGEFLGRRSVEHAGIDAPIVSLRQQLGPAVARCATAHALAVIAHETQGP